MKHTILFLIVIVMAISGCTTGSSSSSSTTVTPVSTFDINFAGHSYHLSSSTNPSAQVSIGASTSTQLMDNYGNLANHTKADFLGGVQVTSKDLIALFACQKLGASSALGVYRAGTHDYPDSSIFYGGLTLVDNFDGGKRYTSDGSGNDINSTITYTASNATQVKGTFSVILSYSNNYYPATGSFEFNK